MDRRICIHGHFYQPPRENPWLDRVELQDSAYPYHDWNRRITAECYEPNTAARILGPDLKIVDIINNYSKMSFNFGPTLLYNLRTESPEVYRGIVEGDRRSLENFSGHGSAMAQVYNHMIMPLASRRDKMTQALWGIRDFRTVFGRDPEGMWLPETAADTETLEVLSELGVKFTILAPRQAKRVKKNQKGARWKDLGQESIDTTVPYLCQLPSGRSIAIFFYNGAISQELGFGSLLDNGEGFARRLASAFPEDDGRKAALVHVATDGESYGHHHRHGDMALSYCIHHIESEGLARLTNYGEFLEAHPPDAFVEIHEGSSWSCVHGIERWRSDCGCNSGGYPSWNQAWRGPFRDAMDWLRDALDRIFESEGAVLLKDPWAARDGYVDVINDRSRERVEAFFGQHAARALSADDAVRALKLLCMQRNAQLMYASCGWFFDEISGIEGVQVMQYAARAIQLAEETTGVQVEKGFEEMLGKAPSNVHGDGAKVYARFAKVAKVDLLRVGAHHAITSLFHEFRKKTGIYSFEAETDLHERVEAGKHRLAIGRTRITSAITWERAVITSAVLHLGEVSLNCGIRYFQNEEEFSATEAALKAVFERGDVPELIRLMDKHFGMSYTLWHLFKDEQRKIIDQILLSTYEDISGFHKGIFEENYGTMDFLRKLGIPVPRPLGVSAEFILNQGLRELLEKSDLDTARLASLIKKAQHLAAPIDPDTIGYVASAWINGRMEELEADPEGLYLMERTRDVLKLLRGTPARLNLWKGQNIYFDIGRRLYPLQKTRAASGDAGAAKWIAAFEDLGNYFHVKVS